MDTNKKLKICLVGAKYKGEDSRSVGMIFEAGEKLGVEMTNIPKGSLYVAMNDGKVEYKCDDVNIDEQDAFIFRGATKMIDPENGAKVSVYRQMCHFAHYLNEKGKVVVDEFLLSPNPTYTKFTDADKLMKAGLPIIPTWVFFKTNEALKHLDILPYPCIIKAVDGARGKDVFKFENKDELKKFLKEDYGSIILYPNMIQKCIENDGDYRIVVVGDKVVVTLKKHRGEGSVVANMSKGNEANAIEADEELKTFAVKAAQTLGIEFAGVDIIEDLETGKRYILEVNLSPQIFLSTQFGKVDIGEELVKYIINKVERTKSK